MLTIRPSRDDDVPAITEIYRYYVLTSTCTFEIIPPTLDEMASRRNDIRQKNLPYLVGEVVDSVGGYAYCTWFKSRPAYRFSVESSIYLEKSMTSKGFGHQLLTALMHEAELVGVRKTIVTVNDSENDRSIRLYRAAGFAHVRTMKSCGWKSNRWINVMLMEKTIGESDTTPPE